MCNSVTMGVEEWDPFQDPAEEDGPIAPVFSVKLDVPPAQADVYKPLVRQPRVIPAGVRCDLGPKAAEGRPVRMLCLHDHHSNWMTLMAHYMQPLFFATEPEDDGTEPVLDAKWLDGTIFCFDHEGRVMREFLTNYKMNGLHHPGGQFDYADPLIDEIDGEKMRVYGGVDEAIEHIENALVNYKPIDVLFGFGQGSDLATIVAARAAAGLCEPLRCVVHAGSNRPGWVRNMPDLFAQKNHIPAFVVYGEQDPFAQGSREVAALYHNPEVYTHAEDHRIFPKATTNGTNPQSEILAKSMRDFILHYARND